MTAIVNVILAEYFQQCHIKNSNKRPISPFPHLHLLSDLSLRNQFISASTYFSESYSYSDSYSYRLYLKELDLSLTLSSLFLFIRRFLVSISLPVRLSIGVVAVFIITLLRIFSTSVS